MIFDSTKKASRLSDKKNTSWWRRKDHMSYTGKQVYDKLVEHYGKRLHESEYSGNGEMELSFGDRFQDHPKDKVLSYRLRTHVHFYERNDDEDKVQIVTIIERKKYSSAVPNLYAMTLTTWVHIEDFKQNGINAIIDKIDYDRQETIKKARKEGFRHVQLSEPWPWGASLLQDKTTQSRRYNISRKVAETALELDEWYSYLTKIDYEGSMDFPPSKPYPHAPLYDAGVRKTSPLGYERMWQTMANLVIDPKWPEDSRVEIDLNIYGANPETQTFDEEIDWSEMSADEDQTADYLDGLIRKAHARAMDYLRKKKIPTKNSIRKTTP